MPLSTGDKLGHYEVLSLLGKGGMGEVWRARDTTLKRDVALKVLPSEFLRDPDRMARFQREAEVLASLDHPNIGPIHGIIDSSDSRGLVLALIEGPTLADRIEAGPVPLEEAVAIAKQIVDALEYAHDRGVVHRDLKPANVKATADGVVKVLDFGLAKVLENEPPASSLTNSPTLTMGHTFAGMILGTAAYMSPEQAVGRQVDRRSDIFSFGSLLYEMLTGQRAFRGTTAPDVLEAVVKSDPDWSALPAETPPYLRRLLERMMVKDRKNRLQAIGEARIALQRGTDEPSPVLHSAGTAKRSGILWPVLAAAGLVMAAGVLVWTYTRPVPVAEVTRFEIHAPPGTTLPLGTPAVSPDGRTVAFVASDQKQIRRIYVRTLDSIEARVLPGTEGAIHPFFSPDGRSLAFASDARKLVRIDLAGGAPRTLADLTGPWHGTWNQDGTILFSASGVMQIAASGGPATLVFAGGHPYFLPDGKRFLTWVSARRATDDVNREFKPRIEMVTLGAKQGTTLLEDADSAGFIAPTPGGPTYMLSMRSSNVMAQVLDEASGKLLGEPVAILDNVGRVASPAVTPTLGVSRSGTLAFQKSTNAGVSRLNWYDRAGKAIGELPPQAAGTFPSLSPDGQSATVQRVDPSTSTEDIWVVDLKRGAASRLTFDKATDLNPAWSPDGKRIMFSRDGVGVLEKDASGAGTETVLLAGDRAADRSPDGKYVVQYQGGFKPILVPLSASGPSGAKPIPVGSLNARSRDFQFSPDGKYLAYSSIESGANEVYVQPTPPASGRWQVSVNGGSQPKWRRDGKELFFAGPDTLMAVDVTLGAAFSAGTPHVLFRVGLGRVGYAASADGKRFLIPSDEALEADSPIIVVQNWWVGLRK